MPAPRVWEWESSGREGGSGREAVAAADEADTKQGYAGAEKGQRRGLGHDHELPRCRRELE